MTNFREEIRKILSLTGFQTRPVSYAYEEAAGKLEELFQSHLRESLERVKSRFDFVPPPDDGISGKEKIIIAQTNMLIGFFHQAIDTELKGLGGNKQ